jgi:cytoskeletal protein RodZ
MFILKFLLILFLAVVVSIGYFVWRVFSSFNNARRQFQENERQQQSSYRRRNGNNENDLIIDQRTPEEANRKIIPDDEGEYVDYEDA